MYYYYYILQIINFSLTSLRNEITYILYAQEITCKMLLEKIKLYLAKCLVI